MPTYQYVCTACGEQSEIVQKFTDAPLTDCLACGGRLRKVFSAVGIVFKGSGFYRTDSRAAAKEAAGAAKPNGAEAGTKVPAGSSAGESSSASSGNGSSPRGSSSGDGSSSGASASGNGSSAGGSSGSGSPSGPARGKSSAAKVA